VIGPLYNVHDLYSVCVVTSEGRAGIGSAGPQIDGKPHLRSSPDNATAYRTVQRRVDALIRGRADVDRVPVPACPQWSVHETVRHLVGTAQDLVSLNLQNAGTDAWTSAQLDRLADRSLDELLDLWAQTAIVCAELFERSAKLFGAQVVFDALTHEYDIRGAIGERGARTDDPAAPVAIGYLTMTLDRSIRRGAMPSLRLTAPTCGTVQLGDPEKAPAHLAIRLSDFEVLRAFGGRRSVRQLLALPWQGDARELLPIFDTAVVRPPHTNLYE
jgi:uncharacterized protein (TIGR03083 family)